MKRNFLIAVMFLASAGFAAAQIGAAPSTDVLGAHLNYGRGCAACHAPHSGARGNGNYKGADSNTGNEILWGEDVGSLFSQTILSGGTLARTGGAQTSYTETLPASMMATTPDVTGMLTCLSCHDGNYAKGAMMKNVLYEQSLLSSNYGTSPIPTLLGNDGTSVGNYLNDHPVGLNAIVTCGGQYNWDCTESAGVISMTGANSSRFVTNYGFFVALGVNGSNAVVVCTTCHNQHSMNVVKVTNGAKSGLTSGNYTTFFFILAPYNVQDQSAGSNQTAQFCRQCHGGEANESNGSTAVTNW
jgi:hypothetical protein